MVIKASAASEIRALVQALSGADAIRREAAGARLAVIGARAVPHILAALRSANRSARIAMLRALEPMADPRAAAAATDALGDGGDLAIAAIGVLRELLEATAADVASGALDALMTAALNRDGDRRVRLAALAAVEHLPDVRRKLEEALAADPDPAIQKRAGGSPERRSGEDAIWHDALDGRLPDDPGLLRDVLDRQGPRAALGTLQKLVDRIRAREEASQNGERSRWRALRGAVHQTLALRGSRVAVYDLRETIEATGTELPPSFLAAVQLVGDVSCLEALAAAYERADPSDARWRTQLGAAFRALALRERVTRRHPLMKRIQARWPDAGRITAG